MSHVENRRLKERRPSVAQLERDAALQRVSATRRWVIGGAAALSAGIAALVSAIAPGHSLGAKSAEAATTTPSGSGQTTARASTAPKKMPPLAKPSDLGLSGPAAGPTAPSNTASGGSGNTGAGPAGNSGNTGIGGNSGNTGGSGNTGNTGASSGNTGAVVAPAAAPPPPTVSSGGS